MPKNAYFLKNKKKKL